MTFAIWLIFALSSAALMLTLWGTFLTLRRLGESAPHLDVPFALYPVSILKPLKGADNGLSENIETFFMLDYPDYELLFSVANASDPARAVVEGLLEKYPRVRARLFVGDIDAGPNPKVNNLIKSYEAAAHDLILISDSNTRVEADYLRRLVAHLESGVGMVTAVVAGRDAESFGGMLEATYLNTFYARWMNVAAAGGNPCVVGKSMLFSRKMAARFGGMRALARYLAEDYMAGVATQALGLKVLIQSHPIHQFIGKYSFKDFWARHIRWGRIRKAQAPLAFAFEPLIGSIVSGCLGAWASWQLFGLPPAIFALIHFGSWSLCDLLVARRLDGALRLWMPLAWLARELLTLPMWAYTASGNTVLWRGRMLELERGGTLKMVDASEIKVIEETGHGLSQTAQS